ncbi:MAG: hypothetical protein JSS32_09690 [Verrucomicrobia bacterium]|nr:hypothetical protein [Verrucomicrobiota bacterium]
MFLFLRLSLLSALAIASLSQGYCGEERPNHDYVSYDLIDLSNGQDGSILSKESNKIYVNPNRISVSEDGITLKSDFGSEVKLPLIACDTAGIFIDISSNEEISATQYPVIKCRNCRRPFSPTFFNRGRCPSCGFQN